MKNAHLLFSFVFTFTLIQNVASQSCKAKFIYTVDSVSKKISITNQSSSSTTMKYIWEFGDGSNSSANNPTHTYTKDGYYKVRLNISDAAINCKDSFTSAYISIGTPECDTNYSFRIIRNSKTMDYVAYNDIKNLKWDFGDGETTNERAGTHQYLYYGNYNVCLTIYCSSKDSFKTCYKADVTNPCLVSFTRFYDSTQKFKVFLVNKSSYSTRSTYFWNFGDGATSKERFPTHKYSTFGKFNVCLTFWDSLGCGGTICDSIGMDASGKMFKKEEWELIVKEEASAGIYKVIKSDFKIYPNPANTKVTINVSNSTQHYYKLEMLNTNGQVCVVQTIEKGNETIDVDLEHINPGLYLIKLSNDNGYSISKMMRN